MFKILLKSGVIQKYFDLDTFLKAVEELFVHGIPFTVEVSKKYIPKIAKAISKILEKLDIKLKVSKNSNPQAVEYVVNAFGGTVLGGLAGAGIGVGAVKFAVSRGVLLAVPGGQVIAAGVAIGSLTGLALGLVATHWEVDIQISSKQTVTMGFQP